jgi:hypothetical protein
MFANSKKLGDGARSQDRSRGVPAPIEANLEIPAAPAPCKQSRDNQLANACFAKNPPATNSPDGVEVSKPKATLTHSIPSAVDLHQRILLPESWFHLRSWETASLYRLIGVDAARWIAKKINSVITPSLNSKLENSSTDSLIKVSQFCRKSEEENWIVVAAGGVAFSVFTACGNARWARGTAAVMFAWTYFALAQRSLRHRLQNILQRSLRRDERKSFGIKPDCDCVLKCSPDRATDA